MDLFTCEVWLTSEVNKRVFGGGRVEGREKTISPAMMKMVVSVLVPIVEILCMNET